MPKIFLILGLRIFSGSGPDVKLLWSYWLRKICLYVKLSYLACLVNHPYWEYMIPQWLTFSARYLLTGGQCAQPKFPASWQWVVVWRYERSTPSHSYPLHQTWVPGGLQWLPVWAEWTCLTSHGHSLRASQVSGCHTMDSVVAKWTFSPSHGYSLRTSQVSAVILWIV